MRIKLGFNRLTAWVVIVLSLIITLGATFQATQLQLDYDFEKFFPKDDKEKDFYLAHRNQFGYDADFLLIAVSNEYNTPIDTNTIKALSRVEKKLQSIKSVTSTQSIASYKIPVQTPFGIQLVPFYQGTLDTVRIKKEVLLYQNLVAKDFSSACIGVQHESNLSKKKSDALLQEIENILAEFPNYQFKVSGKIQGQKHYITQMQNELMLFIPISLLLLTLLLFISFRSFWAVWVPQAVVLLSVISLMSTIAFLGKTLSVLTILLPTILFVVGISDMIHLLENYLAELRKGFTKIDALKKAYKHVGMATLLTSITTAFGFITLMVSKIEPIQQFGLYAAIGVMLAFIFSFTTFPALLILLPKPKVSNKKKATFLWKKRLYSGYLFSNKNGKKLSYGFILLSFLSIVGLNQLKVDNYLLEDWNENDPKKQEYYYFDQQYSGVRPVEFQLKTDTLSFAHPYIYNQVEKLELYLKNQYKAGSIISPNTALKSINRARNGGSVSNFKLSQKEESKYLTKWNKNDVLKQVITSDFKTARIAGRIKDFGGNEFQKKNEALYAFIQTEFDTRHLSIQQTGMAYLIDKNNRTLSSSMLGSLMIAFISIGLIMMGIFKSWKMLFISFIPNFIPLLFTAGFMYLFEIDIKVSTAIIFTIAFGIAVDDTIHFLSKYKLERKKGLSKDEALKETYIGAGKAIIVTSIILLSGFIPLIFSSFASTFYLGLLISFSLFCAILADLFLLPFLIRKSRL